MKCPCHSKKEYAQCCKPIHEGISVKQPEALMRARYSAYAKGLVDFIIETSADALREKIVKDEGLESWKAGVLAFSKTTDFRGLEIIEAKGDSVTFKAILYSKIEGQKGSDISFQEKSLFVKEPNWRYLSGEVRETS